MLVPALALAATTVAPPQISASFSPGGIQPNGVSTLTINITNPATNSIPETGVAFTDNFPANLTVASPTDLTNSCGGTATATAGSGSVSLADGTVATNSACTVTVNVTSSFTGDYPDSTGAVTSDAGTGNSASATLFVANPPTISDQFIPSTVTSGDTSLLSFTVENPNSDSTPPNNDVTLTGISFTDDLPAGLVVANPNDASNSCDGTLTATPGASAISLTGGTLSPAVGSDESGGCFISVEVLATTPSTFNNTTGPISANESGQGSTSNTATLTATRTPAVEPPTLAESAATSPIALGGSTELTFTVANPNSGTAFSNAGFSDPLPAGLAVANPNGVGGSCLSDGGVVSALPGSASVSLFGVSLPANSSCSLFVTVMGTAGGSQQNTTGPVTGQYDPGSGEEPATAEGGSASATVIVVPPPTVSAAFGAKSVTVGGTTPLTVTITNPAVDPVAEVGVAFTDQLGNGIKIASPGGLSGDSCGGAVGAPAGANSFSLSGGTIPAHSSCKVTVNVVGVAEGVDQNTIDAVQSDNGGTGPGTSSAVFVGSPPSLSAAFARGRIVRGKATKLRFTIHNPNGSDRLTGLGFTVQLPRGLVVATQSLGLSRCGGGKLTARKGGRTIDFSGGQLGAGASCTFGVSVRGTRSGVRHARTTEVIADQTGAGNQVSPALKVRTPPKSKAAAIHR